MRRTSLLARLAVGRPITTLVVFVSLLVLGSIAVGRIPLQLMPSGLELPYLWVWAPYRRTAPVEIERRVVHPTEDALAPLAGLKHIFDRAGNNGAWFQLEFEQNQDMDETWNRVMDRLDRVRPSLPSDFDRYWLFKYDPDADSVVWAAITLPNNEDDFTHLITTRVQRMLERIDGVARVEVNGMASSWVQVDFSRNALEGSGTNLVEAINSLANDDLTLASGEVRDAGRRVLVRGLAPLSDLETVRSLPLSSGRRLDEVAAVDRVRSGRNWVNRVNGSAAITLDIYKEADANTVSVTEAVRRVLLEELTEDPELASFGFHILWDSGQEIKQSLGALLSTMLWGGILAVLVLYVFLRQVRLTLIIGLAIPLSIGIAVVALYFQGHSINLISLIGLMLAVGMVIDNAIVVAESIVLERELGTPARAAAVRGAGHVGMAIIMATCTTLVIFLPLILLGGDSTVTFFMTHLGLPVCYALLASLWAALYGIPAAAVALSKRDNARAPKPTPWITALQRRYTGILDWALRHRARVVLIAIAFFFTFLIPRAILTQDDDTGGGHSRIIIQARMAGNLSFAEREEVLLGYEEWLLDNEERWEIDAVRVRLGQDSFRGRMQVFVDRDTSERQRLAILQEMKDEIPEVPGCKTSFGWGRGEAGGKRSLTVQLEGDDTGTLMEAGDQIAARLRALPGVVGAEVEQDDDSRRELQVLIDTEAAGQLGVRPGTAAQVVRFGLRGADLKPLYWDEEEVPFRAGFDDDTRLDSSTLGDLRIPAGPRSLPLSSVATLVNERAQPATRRYDRRTAIQVRVDLEEGDRKEVWKLVEVALASWHPPEGVRWGAGRWLEDDTAEQLKELQIFGMSILFVFLLIGTLFESLVLPAAALISIPFAVVGAYWTLFLTGSRVNALAAIGFPLLVGIVVNNAIVLIDRIEQLRGDGLERDEALRTGALQRFRPVVMTAATTIMGLLPMALGGAAVVDISYAPLGRAVAGGLVISTVMTLVLVPVAYSLLDDYRNLLMRIGRYALRRDHATDLPAQFAPAPEP
jgi:HAE1 family hydrophobic/amphiphilic exporter-1